jgi:Kdo2-lipid IVA lauroyltransferase/acyltransferase
LSNQHLPEFRLAFFGPRYWFTWIQLAFFKLLGFLPFSLCMTLGRWLGDLFYLVGRQRRDIARINIALCFPEHSPEEREQMVRKSMQSTGKMIIEAALALWGPKDRFRNRYTINGLDRLEKARQTGQGILLVGCHLTTLDVTGRIIAYHFGYDLLYRPDNNPLLAYMIAHGRDRFSVGDAIARNDLRKLVSNLRAGHIVWYAPDQDFGPSYSVFAPFFGVQAASMTGTARICRMGKAIAMPLVHYRDEENNRYEVTIGEPLEGFPTGDEVADATRINQLLEAAILPHPEQYFWVHRRFKTRPPGEPGFYPPKKRRKAN